MEPNFNKILNGWKNYIDKSEVVEKVAEQRAEICGRCPFAVEKKILIFVKDDFKEVEGMACNRCDCPLSMKIRSINESCPEKLW
jgi:predicted PP-loop superfamily ATPase